MLLRGLLICALLMFLAGQASAATYYVAKTGSDSNNCTQAQALTNGVPATPKLTITSARTCWSGGDTISIRAGTYTEGFNNTIPSGTAASPTTVTNFNGESVTLKPTGSRVIYTLDKSHIKLHGLILDGGSLTVTDGCCEVIKIDRLTGNVTTGIIVEDCDIKDSPWNTMLVKGSNHRIQRNVIHGSGRGQSRTDCCYGIYLSCEAGGCIVHKNEIHNHKNYALHVYPTSVNCVFTENLIYNNGVTNNRPQVLLSNADHIFRRNIIRGPGASSAPAMEVKFQGCARTIVEQNTIYQAAGTTGILVFQCTNAVLRNNIVLGHSSNNIDIGSTNTTLTTNLTSGTATDIFTNPSGGDLTLKAGSAAINNGTAVSGQAFNGSAPDQGAFETFGCSLANASANTAEVTCQMSLNVPILPATGQTTWTVKFSGVARTTTAAVRKSGTDSVVQITYDGAACQNTDTMTIDYTSGTVTDSALIGNNSLNQQLLGFTGLAVDESACTGGGGGSPPAGEDIVYHFNDASLGVCCADSSGNDNDATVTGSPSLVTGLIDGALYFPPNVDNYATMPFGSGFNPTTASLTICALVSPDSVSAGGNFLGAPFGTNQRAYLSIAAGGTWSHGVQGSTLGQNNEFPVSSGYSLPCIEFNHTTSKATLIVNAVRGTTENNPVQPGDSVKPYTSYTFAGNVTVGKANGAAASTIVGMTFDEVFVFPKVLTQQEHTDLYNSLINPSPTPTGNYEQKTHKWQRLRKNASGDPEDFTISGTTNGITMSVMVGGAIELVTQIDCTVAACDPSAARLFFNVNGGTFSQVNDVCGTVCFYGETTDSDVVSGAVTCCLTGALTANDGTTQFTSSAVPSFDLDQDASFVRRSVLKVGSGATEGDTICFKEYHQTGNALDAYTPTAGACVTIVGVAAGVGF